MRKGVWEEKTINVPHYILECPYCKFSVDETEINGRSLPLFCGGCGARLRTQEKIDEIEEKIKSHSLSKYSRFMSKDTLLNRDGDWCNEYEMYRVKSVETWANKQLSYYGLVTFSSVLEHLDLPVCDEDIMIGWKRGEKTDCNGIRIDIVPKDETGFWVDFNVDGWLYFLNKGGDK